MTTLPTAATLNADEFGGLPPRLAVPFHPESALLLMKHCSRSSPTLEATSGDSELIKVAFSSSGYGGREVWDSGAPRPDTTRRGSGVVKYSGGYASMVPASTAAAAVQTLQLMPLEINRFAHAGSSVEGLWRCGHWQGLGSRRLEDTLGVGLALFSLTINLEEFSPEYLSRIGSQCQ
ncbi:hypothetical protein AA313_de0207556 [Arthrobotrys entomopaga]|nr:hypothetical protein AA313_de0207556 [Arthrobotrys entomopaga]